jgi:large repetitive protein
MLGASGLSKRVARWRLAAVVGLLSLGCLFDRAGIHVDAGWVEPEVRDAAARGQPDAGTVAVDGRPAPVDSPPAADVRRIGTDGAASIVDAAVDREIDRAPDLAPDRPVVDAPPAVILRINVNGPAHAGVDFGGAWAADPGLGGVCGPSVYGNLLPVAGTRDDSLFQGEAFGNPLVCSVGRGTLPSGRYQVNLYFAEIYWGPGCPGGGPGLGARLFDIRIEGMLVAEGVDLFREAGCASSPLGTGRPVVKRFETTIVDGGLDLRFEADADNAKISAIELLSTF